MYLSWSCIFCEHVKIHINAYLVHMKCNVTYNGSSTYGQASDHKCTNTTKLYIHNNSVL